MAAQRPITNDRLYDALNSARLELKGDINRLETKFDTLEAGRLTRLEGKVSDLQVARVRDEGSNKAKFDVNSLKFVIIQTIMYVLLFVLLQAVANKWVK